MVHGLGVHASTLVGRPGIRPGRLRLCGEGVVAQVEAANGDQERSRSSGQPIGADGGKDGSPGHGRAPDKIMRARCSAMRRT
jgi:hypothetical protein